MRLSKLSLSLYVLLIFLSGAAVGAFASRLYTVSSVSSAAVRRPEEYRKRYLDEMQSRLGLTTEQVKTLGAILDETRARFHETRERMKPQMDAIKLDQTTRIRAILNDTQRAEFEKMRAEREAKQKAGGGRPPGPPGF
jgi:hypothetical protein